MAITPQTRLRLLKVPIELDNKNQLTFSNEQAQRNYFLSLPHLEIDEISYQRKDDVIWFPEHIDNLLEYNYVMYLNDNYTNKWFYAFITNMQYENDYNTKISIETDVFQTWQFNLTFKKCFVEREHVNVSDDIVGNHTFPENLETGEYICNEHYKDSTMDNYSTDLCFVMASTSEPVAGDAKDTVAPSAIYNGIYTGLTYYRYDVTSAIDTMLEIFANYGKTDAINGVFMAPKWLAVLDSQSILREVEQSNSPKTFTINVTKQTSLNGYSPRNQKLKCFPYNYLLLSNNIGQNSILHYEKFSNNSNATFQVKGVLNPRLLY